MANSCHVLQSLIFMMLNQMGETDTDHEQVPFMILFDYDISAWMLQFCILKCNITAFIFFKGSEC